MMSHLRIREEHEYTHAVETHMAGTAHMYMYMYTSARKS
jgi:hypothetical protein